jgi:FAD/FMN-containing dehydrogenase
MERVSMITVSNLLSSVPPLFSDLAKVLSGEIIFSTQAFLESARDGSPYEVIPQAIIYPKTATDIKHTIAFSREYKIPITIRGGKSAHSGGALGEGVILDLTHHFNRIRNVNMLEHTVTVDAGVTLSSLMEKLKAWNVEIPVLCSVNAKETVGGLVGTKSATASSFFAGTIREWIEGVTVIVDTGEEHSIRDGITPSGRLLGIYQAVFPLLSSSIPILRAAKPENADDASGYSIWNTSIGPRQLLDQLVGSEGTLGVITSVTFRVTPCKPFSVTYALPIQDTASITSYIEQAKKHGAEKIFLFDQTFHSLAERLHPKLLPSSPFSLFTLLVTYRGIDMQKVQAKAAAYLHALNIQDAPTYDEIVAEKISHSDFTIHMMEQYAKGTHRVITTAEGLITSSKNYPHIIHAIDAYMAATGKLYIVSGFAGSGHLSLLVLTDPKSKQFEEELLHFNEEILSIAKKYKAGISAVGGDGLARTPYLHFLFNDQVRTIFKQLKEVWDPNYIFNPSKKVGGDLNYLRNHISRR